MNKSIYKYLVEAIITRDWYPAPAMALFRTEEEAIKYIKDNKYIHAIIRKIDQDESENVIKSILG